MRNFKRICRNVRADRRYSNRCKISSELSISDGVGVYNIGILVYFFDIVCQSGSNFSAVFDKYFCRNQSEQRLDVFIAQLLGAFAATIIFGWLLSDHLENDE